MANSVHVNKLQEGVESWNKWRETKIYAYPDLSGINLKDTNLSGADLSGANLSQTYLAGANLSGCDLSYAILLGANLAGADLSNAQLRDGNYSGADFSRADLSDTNLSRTNLFASDLSRAYFSRTYFLRGNFKRADFTNSFLNAASFNAVDLSEATGLEQVSHLGPSYLSIDTLYLSKGRVPEAFLLGCGVPEEFVRYIPSIIGAEQAIQFYSCFISYSSADEAFARRLHARMREAKLRVWFAPEDMKGGRKIYEQIESAIQVHDRLLLVLSETSIKSEWVLTEVRRALKTEKKENRRKLFPIRLVDYERLKEWELVDSDSGNDLATEIRSYFIPDFSNWKNHDAFETAFAKLLQDLKAEDENPESNW
ncbi:toll/interleukin-1 receptor domain-containing protein [Flavisolibacter ginsenosidimutans]|uniref:Toll/interleukin-1 receptor domain-containing protein n=1 Tax=Flavisolibacter ginsenosidimutans TaxID=661481 RepID=A0A5B8UJZ7_9BACT|nr:toll/interleukin-1 receptor domain-containing protein [Flavisolibacter ginsenosidimutans]QEC56722.1 toll/interleukin-1 receptor domain-containing protein [Flavisolibacter ginsenosidimutans]